MGAKRNTSMLLVAASLLGGAVAFERDTFGPALPAFGSVPAEGGTVQHIGKICTADTNGSCPTERALKVYGGGERVDVAYNEISPFVVRAVVAVEDHGFWNRTDGVSVRSNVRALIHNMKAGQLKEGGSTIDRQFAGMGYQYTSDAGRLLGQFREMSRAKKINQVFTERYGDSTAAKQEIMRQYLNSVFFGRQAYGIEAAALGYFGKHADKLTEAEGSLLAGVINQPSNMDLVIPHATSAQNCKQLVSGDAQTVKALTKTHPAIQQDCKVYQTELATLKARYAVVVSAMERYDGLPKKEADALRSRVDTLTASIIPYTSPQSLSGNTNQTQQMGAMYAVHAVESQAAEILGIDTDDLRGYTIQTTIRAAEQATLYSAIAQSPFARQPNLDIGGVIVAQDGAITALVGSKDATGSSIDFSAAQRPMGSSIKPFIWTKAYGEGLHSDEQIQIEDLTVPGANNGSDWVVHDHACEVLDRQAPCTMTPAEALAASSNSTAVQLATQYGYDNIFEAMQKIGIPKPHEVTPSTALGTSGASAVDLVAAYNGLVANKGTQTGNYLIRSIINRDGKVVYEHEAGDGDRVYDRDDATQTIEAMKLVHSMGTAKGSAETPFGPGSLAGKTGTSDDLRDLRYAGSVCIPGDQPNTHRTRTVALSIGDPSGTTAIPERYSSNDAARIGAGALVSIARLSKPAGTCDLAR